MIASVDEFILYDEVQFTKNDWRNRNKIKTVKGLEWLTIPVGQSIERKISEVSLPDGTWRVKHLKTLETNYRKAPFYSSVMELILPVYQQPHTRLSEFNEEMIRALCRYLGIRTKITQSEQYNGLGDRNGRLVNLCQCVSADVYVSGPAAKSYLETGTFEEVGISVDWFDYSNYPEYPQLWGDFVHEVSILDLLFNCGPKSAAFMKHV